MGERRLTSKQEAFANAIIGGANPLEAYRAAGYSQRMSAHAQSAEAHKLLSHPDISLRIESGRKEAAQHAKWSRETAISRLEAVNLDSYNRIMKDGLTKDSTVALRGFLETTDRLNDMIDTGDVRPVAPMFYFDRGEADNCPAIILGVEPERYGEKSDENKQVQENERETKG